MKNIIRFSIIYFGLAFLFFAASSCIRRQQPPTDQVFWDPAKDTAWQELLAQRALNDTLPKISTEGAKLFNLYCATCHFRTEDMICPKLKGARQRWITNASEEKFYAFIKNPKEMIDKGEPYANRLFRKWGIYMQPQQLTDEQIDEIFVYVEN
ncbi:c-type cytochrome [bacterium AH-315-B15]|nr:c-type cytochrome [bacterium AH-315-B15]